MRGKGERGYIEKHKKVRQELEFMFGNIIICEAVLFILAARKFW